VWLAGARLRGIAAGARVGPVLAARGLRFALKIHCDSNRLVLNSPLLGNKEAHMARREFLSGLAKLAALPFVVSGGLLQGESARKPLKILMKSALGSDDPTKAAFPFSHGLALTEAGHQVQIYLLGEAVVLMRRTLANAVTPVGWPTVGETLDKLAAKHVQIYACGACSRARGVTETDLNNYGAKFGSPPIFVSLIEWADHVITE